MKFNQPRLSPSNYRADIDGLRGVAVLSAVAFHAFPEWMAGRGFIGPEVFFVISGFLISKILFRGLEQGSFTFRDFYARRARRVFPALLAVLIVCYAAGWFALLASEYKQLGKHIAAGAGFVSNIVLWGEAGYFDTAAETKILLHLWTLAIEEQFYLIWPLLLWLSCKSRMPLLLITVLGAAISFYLNIYLVHKDTVATFYLPQTRFWELASGAILAWSVLYWDEIKNSIAARQSRWTKADIDLFFEKKAPVLSNVVSWLGAALLGYGFYRIKTTFSFPGYWAVIPVIATVLIIAAGSSAWFNRAILSNRVMVAVGLVSYPLYLWHWPLLCFARIIQGEAPSESIRVTAVLISAILAWLTYQFAEKPARSKGHERVKVVILIVLLCAVGAAGYGVYLEEGLPSRASMLESNKAQEDSYFSLQHNEKWLPLDIAKYSQQVDVERNWSHFRYHACFLGFADAEENFQENGCLWMDQNRKNVLILGDSHAAQLYYGLKARFPEINFLQVTNFSCYPLFDTAGQTKICADSNQKFLGYWLKDHPIDGLILAARWQSRDIIDKVIGSLERYETLAPSVAIVGPVPRLEKDIKPIDLVAKLKDTNDAESAINHHLRLDIFIFDQIFVRALANRRVRYISLLDVLCKDRVCKQFDAYGAPIMMDNNHITIEGSTEVAKAFDEFIHRQVLSGGG